MTTTPELQKKRTSLGSLEQPISARVATGELFAWDCLDRSRPTLDNRAKCEVGRDADERGFGFAETVGT